MELTYVHDAPMPTIAANNVQVVKMCRAFCARGAEVRLLSLRPPGDTTPNYSTLKAEFGLPTGDEFDFQTLPLRRLPARMLLMGFVGAVRRSVSRSRVVYTRSISAAAGAIAAGRNVALEMHQPLSCYRRHETRLRRVVRSRRFRLMVVISERLRAAYEADVPALRDRILVAHDGADATSEQAHAIRLSGAFRVGYVGHLYPGKGMEIIARIAPACPWADFHVVGGAPADLERWKSSTQGLRNLHFHGHVAHAETARYISSMDVVLAPYLRTVRGSGMADANLADWMSPLKLFEYMAAAKPILASRLPVLQEVLRDGENALLVDPDDIASWCRALDTLRHDAEARVALGLAARRALLDRFTWERRASSILEALGGT